MLMRLVCLCALGLELTIYDPKLDPDRTSATRLVTLLERVLGGTDGTNGTDQRHAPRLIRPIHKSVASVFFSEPS
ncbi:MAG: hypothetical protein M3O61_07095, partial [Gemmatimonadota bacterium]|nr:hypothetical protein [Gemmatimonadota bacterium]